jgi:hypothetical protein
MNRRNFNLSKSMPSAAGRVPCESSTGRSLSNQNIRGVNFLREGNIDEAVCILRSLVLPPGCTWTRPDAPNLFKRNFATALLLAGHPSGCLELLAEMRDEQNPRVQQLRAAIKRWEKTLSFVQWVNWRTGWIEPDNRPVAIDFVPGELEGELPRTEATLVASTSSKWSTAV